MTKINWLHYPKHTPKKSGYYYTRYFNTQYMDFLYKSLWYSCETDEWMYRIKPHVACYIEETYNQYYIPSEELAVELFKNVN